MAIEIIPRKPDNKSNSLMDVIFYVVFFLLAATILSYFGIRYFDGKTADKHKEVLIQITAKETPEVREKERQILLYRDKINDYSAILDKHTITSNAFSFLEKLTHPQVIFSWFSLDEGDALLSLSGTADNFESLGQQVLLFEGDRLTANVILKKVSLAKDGSVDFQVDITLDPKIFTNWPEVKILDK
ncbi:MAG: hypothetical protein V1905_02605 [bacterium]